MDALLGAYGNERQVDESALPPLKRIKVNATPDVPDVMVRCTTTPQSSQLTQSGRTTSSYTSPQAMRCTTMRQLISCIVLEKDLHFHIFQTHFPLRRILGQALCCLRSSMISRLTFNIIHTGSSVMLLTLTHQCIILMDHRTL